MNTKTPIMILQELMVKLNLPPPIYKYIDCVSGSDSFECSVETKDVFEVGSGRTKKDAKQAAASLALEKLNYRGINVPTQNKSGIMENCVPVSHSSVADLQDFCTEYQLPTPVYQLLNEVGPAHSKIFTYSCSVGSITKTAAGTTKKIAKQLTASKMLLYYKNNLPSRLAEVQHIGQDVVAKLNDLAKTKYAELNNETEWRPNLGQIIDKYHLAFRGSMDEQKCREMTQFLENYSEMDSSIVFIEDFFKKIPLDYEWTNFPSKKCYIACFNVPRANPPIVILCQGENEYQSKENCARQVINYLRLLLNV